LAIFNTIFLQNWGWLNTFLEPHCRSRDKTVVYHLDFINMKTKRKVESVANTTIFFPKTRWRFPPF